MEWMVCLRWYLSGFVLIINNPRLKYSLFLLGGAYVQFMGKTLIWPLSCSWDLIITSSHLNLGGSFCLRDCVHSWDGMLQDTTTCLLARVSNIISWVFLWKKLLFYVHNGCKLVVWWFKQQHISNKLITFFFCFVIARCYLRVHCVNLFF